MLLGDSFDPMNSQTTSKDSIQIPSKLLSLDFFGIMKSIDPNDRNNIKALNRAVGAQLADILQQAEVIANDDTAETYLTPEQAWNEYKQKAQQSINELKKKYRAYVLTMRNENPEERETISKRSIMMEDAFKSIEEIITSSKEFEDYERALNKAVGAGGSAEDFVSSKTEGDSLSSMTRKVLTNIENNISKRSVLGYAAVLVIKSIISRL
ncbi:hypothetical protein [Candidatus Hydrogenosomobacter endosymbioticus]|uniref:Uncharacterized protein n=1 Tax=Candidatus Hydrogenosomobacter endosymbioticus TaxID=2558174 RepID=A0ABN6L3D5_9PROT|nr:hypothetical protein [Candidatus Hydrogenosomobacter endosymbioticus]BDB96441.1 hypothetical protein HYD_5740 [Candidatus Hydrogenosomobacter endosymbioticus]